MSSITAATSNVRMVRCSVVVGADQLPDHLVGLFDYMLKTSKVEEVHDYDPELLHILSDDVLKKIHDGNENWEHDVPESVMKAIKSFKLFGYQESQFQEVAIESKVRS